MYYILYSSNKGSQRKENVIKKVIKRKNTFTVLCCIYWGEKTPKNPPGSNRCFSRSAVILTTRKKSNEGHEELGQITEGIPMIKIRCWVRTQVLTTFILSMLFLFPHMEKHPLKAAPGCKSRPVRVEHDALSHSCVCCIQ